MTRDELRQTLHQVLEERRSIDDKRHADDHQFIKLLRERERRRIERIERLKTQIIGWGIISSVGAGVSAIGYGVMQYIRNTKGG